MVVRAVKTVQRCSAGQQGEDEDEAKRKSRRQTAEKDLALSLPPRCSKLLPCAQTTSQ